MLFLFSIFFHFTVFCNLQNNNCGRSLPFGMVLDGLGIEISLILGCYLRILLKNNDKKSIFSHGMSCSSFKHYIRDRSSGERDIKNNNNNNSNESKSNAVNNILLESVNENMIDISDKIHAFLYKHMIVDESESKDIEEDEDIMFRNNQKNETQEIQMNVEKFVIECPKNSKGKFGFGDICQYYYSGKNAPNFIVPKSIFLFDEVCLNPIISSKYCLNSLDFWCVFMEVIALLKAFRSRFKARYVGRINFEFNVSMGALISTIMYMSSFVQ